MYIIKLPQKTKSKSNNRCLPSSGGKVLFFSMKNRNSIIFSLDDFGISQTANDAILELLKTGKIARVSVMMNGMISPAEVAGLLASKVELDIHLDLPRKLTRERKLKEGVLKRLLLFNLRYFFGENRPNKVARAWNADIQKFVRIFGKIPDGLSSHQYVHFHPSYFKIILRLGKKYGIKYLRYGKKGFLKSHPSRVCSILGFLRKLDDWLFSVAPMDSSDYMASLDWIENVSDFENALPSGTTEIICHPERTEEFEFMKKYL